ncbi:hypothetical protein EF847_09870 [Actinobacteria bacterium YIM 96077]|uniref:ArsR family transcriptional regulator n=2 Tax=Phytoactinopolyspora halophila TaxID=1981511 RepID=A0A329QMS7_9ACTN|nr:hypothetical protein EF847_09870 [Actinobacteria bacterium YIM 96077]RAW13231.1 hypothetical protein DPM12_12895 [Phytoactinopolyspora halophila]
MKPAAPPAFPLLRSQMQADLLVRLFIGQVEESVSDLAAAVDAHAGNALREVERLERGDIVVTRRIGRSRLVRANTDAPFYRALHELIVVTMGPAHVLTAALGGLERVASASIVGAWAAYLNGAGEPAPTDVELLVVGTPDRDDLDRRAAHAARRLGSEVLTTVISPAQWRRPHDRVVRAIASGPQVPLLADQLLEQRHPLSPARDTESERRGFRFSVIDLLGTQPEPDGPDDARPDDARPDDARPDATKPGGTGPDRTGPYGTGANASPASSGGGNDAAREQAEPSRRSGQAS